VLAPRSSGPGGDCHSSPGHRYPDQWKLNTLSKAVPPLSGAGENAGGPPAHSPRCLFPAMGGRGCGATDPFLKPVGALPLVLPILARLFHPGIGTSKKTCLCEVLPAGLVHSPPSSVGGVAHTGPAKMAHSPTAINTAVSMMRFPLSDGNAQGAREMLFARGEMAWFGGGTASRIHT